MGRLTACFWTAAPAARAQQRQPLAMQHTAALQMQRQQAHCMLDCQ